MSEPGVRDGLVLTEERIEPSVTILTASGALDAAAAPMLRERLRAVLARGARRIVLDFTSVTFIDSVSLAAVVAAHRQLGKGGRVAIVAQDPYVLLIFKATGLEGVLALRDSRELAEAYVARGAGPI